MRTETARKADGDEITCTIYPDLGVRQTMTDTPAPSDATLLRTRDPQPCAGAAAGGRKLGTAYYGYAGRQGPYLLFEDADPHGAVGFLIFDARDGRKIIDDATLGGVTQDTFRGFVTGSGSLTLAYRRGTDLACAIPAAPKACWRSVANARSGALPPAIARLAPPAQTCTRSYRAAATPRDDPSVIAYTVRVMWTRDAGTRVRANGPFTCLPLP